MRNENASTSIPLSGLTKEKAEESMNARAMYVDEPLHYDINQNCTQLYHREDVSSPHTTYCKGTATHRHTPLPPSHLSLILVSLSWSVRRCRSLLNQNQRKIERPNKQILILPPKNKSTVVTKAALSQKKK